MGLDLEEVRNMTANTVQAATTTPAAPAQAGGLVNGATITVGGAFVTTGQGQQAINNLEQVRGTETFTLIQGANGQFTANNRGGQHLVPDLETNAATTTVTATLRVRNEPPRTVQLQVDRSGSVTVAPPAVTPAGAPGQGAAPSMP